jgi:hypothetical protein
MSRTQHVRRFSPLLVGAAVVAVIGLLAPAASAATSATATVQGDLKLNAGTDSGYTYTLRPASGQIKSFNLTAPDGWTFTGITSVTPSIGSVLPATTFPTNVLQGRNLAISSSTDFVLKFTARAPCADTNSSWKTAAKTNANFTGGSFSVPDVHASVSGSCFAAFTRPPANAAFNDPPTFKGPSQNITSAQYTPNTTSNNAIQVLVTDAAGSARSGIEITLSLSTNPTKATLSGSLKATSNGGGYATFPGSPNPITIDTIGQDYEMTPTASGVVGTESGPFDIYQEGEVCGTGSCDASGRSVNNLGHVLTAGVSAPSGIALGVFVSTAVDVECAGYTSPFSDPPSIVWQYSGSDPQRIVVDISKGMMREVLDRGSDHLEFCFDSEGKTFVDKFGSTHTTTPGLLPDCNATSDGTNCIVSETALAGGGRRVVVTVEDGKGRI